MVIKRKFQLPKRALTNLDLIKYSKIFKITHFRGVFCRDALPYIPKQNERGIINLDITSGPGTHWVAYIKKAKIVIYYDPIGNIPPPPEVLRYFRNSYVYYNHHADQKPNTVNCGHLCIQFLTNKL